MYPEILIWGHEIPTYGVLGVSGVLLGGLYIWIACKRFNLKRDDAIYIYTLGVVGVIIGAKLLYIFTVLPSFIKDIPYIVTNTENFIRKYLSGGMVFYGGIIGGLIFAVITAKSYKVHLSDFYPVLIPAVALASSIGRIGCLLAGCCYGKETTGWFGIVFNCSNIAPNGVPLVPVQLIEAVCDFIIFIILILYSANKNKKANILSLYLLLYTPLRFILEFYRGDSIRGFFIGLSTSQWISIIIFISALFYLVRSKKATDYRTER